MPARIYIRGWISKYYLYELVGAHMWKRKQRNSLGQELYDAANDLAAIEKQLLELSWGLVKTDHHHLAETAARIVLTLQERERQLRAHAERLSRSGNHGRRFTDANDARNSDRASGCADSQAAIT